MSMQTTPRSAAQPSRRNGRQTGPQTTPQSRPRSGVRIILATIWRRGEGRYALVILSLWILTAAISLVWTPRPLLQLLSFGY